MELVKINIDLDKNEIRPMLELADVLNNCPNFGTVAELLNVNVSDFVHRSRSLFDLMLAIEGEVFDNE